MMKGVHLLLAILISTCEPITIPTGLSSVVRYRARVAYDGNGFAGFQLQTRKNCRTVQGDLEDVVNRRLLGSVQSAILPERIIKVVAASRTDAGVHARGQAIHFDVPDNAILDDLKLDQLCRSLNDMLSSDIRIWNLQRVPGTVIKPVSRANSETDNFISSDTIEMCEFQWNVLFDSTQKLYSYRLNLAPVMDPVQRWSRWHPSQAQDINVDTLSRILSYYVGTHDFRAFAGAIERNEKSSGISLTTIRTVFSVSLNKEDDDGNYRIDFLIKGALYKQIRNMVGTAISVCRGELQEEDFLRLLRQGSTLTRVDNRCRPAPPEGLTLEYVYFDDPTF